MIYRNLLQKTHQDVQTVLNEGGEDFLKRLEEVLYLKERRKVIVHVLYVISSIASGNKA